MRFVVDTNILFHDANKDSPEHAVCRAHMARWRENRAPCCITWGIAYEFLRLATHPRVLPHPWTAADACAYVETFANTPGFSILGESPAHLESLRSVAAAAPAVRGNLFFDARTVALMREHGIRTIYTHDADFHRFPGIQVIDPLAG